MRNSLTADLDRIQQEILESATVDAEDHPKQLSLQGAVRSFDTPPKLRNLAKILQKHEFSDDFEAQQDGGSASVEWLVLARATVVVYEGFIEELFQRALPLSENSIYWDQVLRHRGWLGLYLLQSKACCMLKTIANDSSTSTSIRLFAHAGHSGPAANQRYGLHSWHIAKFGI
jgi:hypothetical protein